MKCTHGFELNLCEFLNKSNKKKVLKAKRKKACTKF